MRSRCPNRSAQRPDGGRRFGCTSINPLTTSCTVPSPPIATTVSNFFLPASRASSAAWAGYSVAAHSAPPILSTIARRSEAFWPERPRSAAGLKISMTLDMGSPRCESGYAVSVGCGSVVACFGFARIPTTIRAIATTMTTIAWVSSGWKTASASRRIMRTASTRIRSGVSLKTPPPSTFVMIGR